MEEDQSNGPSVASTPSDFPDASNSNHRPPRLRDGPVEIPTKYDTKLLAVGGDYLCTAGYITRVWSLRTGEVVMNLPHADNVKATAVVFKPAPRVEDEGTRLWLGTSSGDMLEVEVLAGAVVHSRLNAHAKREIIRIYRHAAELWSIDDDGRLHLWQADANGEISLLYSPHTLSVPRGHSFSMVVGNKLWYATGRDIRVLQPSADPSVPLHVLPRPLSQAQVGDVTSGAVIPSQPDRVYFGHADGKLSVYSRADYGCVAIVSVSLYKISALVGVGDYLWAGYHTGMVYVYDTGSQPWRVLKDWAAHEHPVAAVAVSRASVWRHDSLPVLTLATDNMLRMWDGMLQDDWLGESDLACAVIYVIVSAALVTCFHS